MGLPVEQALAGLRREFDDQVENFARDMKLDALIEAERERRQEEAEHDAVVAEVEAAEIIRDGSLRH